MENPQTISQESSNVPPVEAVGEGTPLVTDDHPSCPPPTPTEENQEVDDPKKKTVTEAATVNKKAPKKKNPNTFQAFPMFNPSWEICPSASKTYKTFPKSQEIAPDVALAEFISTSASFHDVPKQGIRSLEWDLLKVFPNNIMPANAAAWYMAKRRYLHEKNFMQQLLPNVLNSFPKKFSLDPEKRTVTFLEKYSKDVAKWKMQYLVHQGLFAYFSHKADEYGVYFFDPLYYENTEPFHANLRLATGYYGPIKSKLIPTYFKKFKDQFNFVQHSQFLVSISKVKVKREINCIGVIRSMINNDTGIIQFQTPSGTEKALFHAKSLFKDGYSYDLNPLKLDAIKFDGFQIPGNPESEGRDYTWYASLIWIGRKPSPKFCTNLATLQSSQFFKSVSMTLEELSAGAPKPVEEFTKPKIPKDQYMKKGEVVEILKCGAVAQIKNTKDRVFIPGWPVKFMRQKGVHLTIPSNENTILSTGDTVAFYLNKKEKSSSYVGVACNVLTLLHAKSGNQAVKADDNLLFGKKGKSIDSPRKKRSRSGRSSRYSKTSESSTGRRRSVSRCSMDSKHLVQFLIKDDIEDECDSDVDPPFIPPPIYEADLDFDEYSDGEIEESEKVALLVESTEDFDIATLVPPPEETVEEGEQEATEPPKNKTQKWLKFLTGEIPPEDPAEEEKDYDYRLPIGVEANLPDAAKATDTEATDKMTSVAEGESKEEEATTVKVASEAEGEEGKEDEQDQKYYENLIIPDDEIEELLNEAKEPLETMTSRLQEYMKAFEESKLGSDVTPANQNTIEPSLNVV